MTPERLEEIRSEIEDAAAQIHLDGDLPHFINMYNATVELLAAYEAIASRKVIHEETRRVWRFEDGEYAVRCPDDPEEVYATPNPAIASEMREEDLPSGHNGRPVTIKITVEEIDA